MKRRVKQLDDAGARRRYEYQLQKRFGITVAQYVTLGKLQGWCCAICGRSREELEQDLVVDHDHATGRVRALLCNACNHGLGRFQDRIDWLLNAVAYLRRFQLNECNNVQLNDGSTPSPSCGSPEHGEG